MNAKSCLYGVVILPAMIVQFACDSEQDLQGNSEQIVLEIPQIRRVTFDAENAKLRLQYEIDVNGVEVDRGNFTGAQEYRITVDAAPGDIVSYQFEWQDTNYYVDYASAYVSELTIGDPMNVTPEYNYNHDDDGDGVTNADEIDGGYSPKSADDSPQNPIIPLDSRRTLVNNLTFDIPVFGCNNSPGGAAYEDWYWLFESDGSLTGVELDNGSPTSRSNRGTYERSDTEIEVKITNERNQVFIWNLLPDAQYLEVAQQVDAAGIASPIAPWGHCVKIDGPNLVL